jgi:hypothetical protein
LVAPHQTGWDTPAAFSMSSTGRIARNLSAAFLAGPWCLDGLVDRGAEACGRRQRWLRTLARRTLAAFDDQSTPPSPKTLAAFITADRAFLAACANYRQRQEQPLRRLFWDNPVMSQRGPARAWQIPPIPTVAALAEWLQVTPAQLDWLADCLGHEARVGAGPLRHYTYRWLAGRSGKRRLLEMPKQRLKAIQRRLLKEILDRIPPHEAAHGYRRGRSVASFVAPHAGRGIVLHFDLRHFFPSIPRSRVHALFRSAGYPAAGARLLAGLCTNVVPDDIWGDPHGPQTRAVDSGTRQRFSSPHLPQGAPTSPALANLCAYRLDCRLAALARAAGARYTRYADDLAFSGDDRLERAARRFQVHVCRIALEEGFEVNTRKTRFMRRGVRQQLAGIVVNAHPNVRRDDYDRLKATLCNCVRNGPDSQNREGLPEFRSYLAGRVAYVAMLNSSRGRRLRNLFDQIEWGNGTSTGSGLSPASTT